MKKAIFIIIIFFGEVLMSQDAMEQGQNFINVVEKQFFQNGNHIISWEPIFGTV